MYQSNMLQPMCYVGEEFLQTQYNTHKIKVCQYKPTKSKKKYKLKYSTGKVQDGTRIL